MAARGDSIAAVLCLKASYIYIILVPVHSLPSLLHCVEIFQAWGHEADSTYCWRNVCFCYAYRDGVTMQANAEPDLAQTGERLRPVMAALIQGILNLVLPSVLAGDPTRQVDMTCWKFQQFAQKTHMPRQHYVLWAWHATLHECVLVLVRVLVR